MVWRREPQKLRFPKEGELLGITVAMLGASRITVDCEDGITRMGRILGKLRKRVWVRVGDLVIVKPWSIEPNKKADVVWRYTRTQAAIIKKKGYGKNLDF